MKNENFRKLQEMRMSVFADAYLEQIEHPETYEAMIFFFFLSVMIDREHDARYNNRVKRLLKKSSLPLMHASVGDIQYLPERHLDRDQINRLSTNEFIIKKRNILLMGATGAGKTFLANAIAVGACWAGYTVLYVRLPDFFIEYANAAAEHKEFDILKKYRKPSLLVLDEFLLLPANDAQQRILLELLERRFGNVSTIFCSQYNEEGWHDQLGGSAIAESILDRITPNSYKITIQGDVSMRQRLGADD